MTDSRLGDSTPSGPVYVIAQLKIHDRERYQRYAERFVAAFARSGGETLAADDAPETLEGTWDRDRLILLRFEDESRFRQWSDSSLHREIAKERGASTDSVVLLVHGIGSESR